MPVISAYSAMFLPPVSAYSNTLNDRHGRQATALLKQTRRMIAYF